MSRELYSSILEQFRQLSLEEQIQLLEELTAIVRDNRVAPEPQHSILELEGLGKEVWQGIDMDQYIENERNSWE